MKNLLIKKMSICAVLFALIFVLSWTVLGMIPLGVVSATTIFLPVVLGIIIIDDWKYSLFLGFGFGLASWLRALLAPSGVLDPYFANPIVSILPRILMGISCHYLYQVYKKIPLKTVGYGLLGGTAAFVNTLFTMTFLCTIYNKEITELLIRFEYSWAGWLFGSICLLNMIPEIVLGIIVSVSLGKVFDVITTRISR